MQVEVRSGRAVALRGDPDHPVTAGWLCAKVNPYLERVYHPDRLQAPLRRVGRKGSGRWREIGWTDAIDEIADRWRKIIADTGAEAILPYSYSGTLGLVQMAVASARLWNRLGASRLERSICMAATRCAVRATLGARMSPPYHQVLDSKLLVFWGHNPVSTAPHLMPFVRRAQRQGCRLVVIDPLRSRSAGNADLYLQPLPGTDAALALAVANEIFSNHLHDAAWLDEYSRGWQALRRRAAQFPAERAAKICAIPASQIRAFARLYASAEPAMIRLGDAVNRNRQGGQTVRAIACLPALTAQYGRRGGGLSCSTGDYFEWDDEAVNHWRDCPSPGRVVNMNRLGAALCGELEGAPIRALFVFAANPMVSAPNTGRVREGLMREDLFTVVHDLFMTDTARYADLVLPATSQLEQFDLHRGYGHTRLGLNQPAVAPLGEAMSNWELMRLLAEAMGFDDPWLREDAEAVADGVLAATRAREPRLERIDVERLMREGSLAFADDDEVPFADGRFPTASGKIEIDSEAFAELGCDSLPEWREPDSAGRPRDLHLVSPAAHHFVNSSLANQPGLARREGRMRVIMHPLDAAARDLEDGCRVRIRSDTGACYRRLEISDQVRPSVVVAVNGYWAQGEVPQTVNWTTSDALADVAGQSTFQSNRVDVERADEPTEESK